MPNAGELLKLFHLLFVIGGVGGMIAFYVVMPMAARSKDLGFVRVSLQYATIFDQIAGIGLVIGGLIGLWLSIYQEWDFGENIWLNVGATLWVVIILIALFILRPILRRLNRMAAEASGPEVPEGLSAEFKKPLLLLTPSALMLIVLVIIYLMVAKPGVDFVGIDNWPVNV